MLQAAIESKFWQDIVGTLNQNISGRLSLHTFISNLALFISNLLGWAKGDFLFDPFHVMPIEIFFGENRR